MDEQQLQQGPLEEQGQPQAEPNLEIQLTPEELDTPLAAVPVDTFVKPSESQVAPALGPQLEGTAAIINSLNAAPRMASMEDMRRAFNEDVWGTPIDEAIYNLTLLEGPRKKERILGILNRSDLDVEQRLDLVRQLEEDYKTPDMNSVERRQLRLTAEAEATGFDDDDVAARDEAAAYTEELPRTLDITQSVPPEAELTKEELRKGYEEFLNQQIEEAEGRAGSINLDPTWEGTKERAKFMGSLAPNLLPFYAAVPIKRIVKRLNELTGENNFSPTGAMLLNGTALRIVRERVEEMPVEQKIKFLGDVLRVLKPNSGVVYHDNAQLKLYTLQNIFYKDRTGKDYIEFAPDAEQKAFAKALTDAEHWGQRKRVETDPVKRAALEQKQRDALAKAKNIDLNAQGRMWRDANMPSFTQWLDDMAILDFVGMGPLVLGTVKAGRRAGMSVLRKLSIVAPEATTKMAIEALQNPRVRQRMGKLLGEDIAETFLPDAVKGAEQAGINGMGALLEREKILREEVRRTRVEGSGVTALQAREFETELKQALGSSRYGALHIDKSPMQQTEEGVEFIARYGKTPEKPFATLSTARKALADMPAHARVVSRDKAGKYHVVSDLEKPTKRGEFYVAYNDKRTYDSSRNLWTEEVFDRKSMRDMHMPSSVVPLSKLWNWFLPTDSVFGKQVSDEIVSASMRSPVIQRLQTQILERGMKLSADDKYIVSALMKHGEELGTVLTHEQIRKLYPKVGDDAIVSYYEARQLADNMFDLANTQQRTEWFRAGVKEIAAADGRVGFGRVLPSADEAIGDIKVGFDRIHVFDPSTNTFGSMSRSDIDALYKKGRSLARMEDLVQGKKFAEATHVLVDGKAVRARELPRHVLTKVPGYYPHIFEGNFVVYGVSKAGNKVALSVAKTIGDANAEIARLQRVFTRMGDKAPYDPKMIDKRFDRSLRDPLVTEKDASDPIFNATSKVYGQRSGRMLRNASREYGDHMVDPIEALLRGMELVSHSVTKGNLIKHMENRLLNTAKLVERETGQRIIKDPRKMIKTPDDINYVTAAEKDHRKMIEYMQQIDMVRHIPDAVERQVAVALTAGAELLDKVASKVAKIPLPGSKSIAKDMDRFGGKMVTAASKGVDPTRLMTEFRHRVLIAGNPVQQFALQLSQVMMLTGVSPRDLPKAISRTLPVLFSLYGRVGNKSPAYLKQLTKVGSKLTGIKEREYDQLIGALERSGLIDSVAMHSQIRTTSRSQSFARQLESAAPAYKQTVGRVTMDALRAIDEQTFGRLSNMGFEAGEEWNRVITFLTLYGRDKRKGVAAISSPAYIQKLVGEVNTLVGSMLRETGMGYQRGWLKAAFQFVAFQHKMGVLMLTNKSLSWQQKTGIALSQVLLFGTKGAFHIDAAHRAFDKWIVDYEAGNPEEKSKMLELYYDPKTQSALNGLVFDMGVNNILRTVGGEDTPGFAWNHRIAPGGGTEFVAQTVMELINNPQTKIVGLTESQGSALSSFIQQVYRVSLAQSKDMDDVPVEERVKMLTKEGASLAFSGYDKYLAASVAQSMGGWVSDTGNIVDASGSGLEYFLAAALGVTTEDRQAYYDMTDKLYGDVRNDPKKHQDALDKIADQMFKRMIDDSVKFSAQAPTPEVYDQLQAKEVQNRALLLSFLTPREQEHVSGKIQEKIAELIKHRKDSAQETFYRNLTKELEDTGMLDKEALEMGVYMKRSPLFTTYPNLQSDFQQKLREISEYDEND